MIAARGEPRPFSVAPMMDRTDRWFRAWFRAISRHALLYTPMIPARDLLAPHAAELLAHDPVEHPLAVQLGGSDPRQLAAAARIAVDAGMIEVNLNCGCPSPAVAAARWGVALMAHPDRVADCVAAMRAAVAVPVTVKHRLGVLGADDPERLLAFVDRLAAAGCDRFVVHARAAVLGGLGPKANRTVPPLRHAEVHALKRARPSLRIETNGGIADTRAVLVQMKEGIDGVMVGRAAVDDPFAFVDVDQRVFGAARAIARRIDVADELVELLARHPRTRVHAIVRHALGLWREVPGSRRARGELAHADVDLATVRRAAACLG